MLRNLLLASAIIALAIWSTVAVTPTPAEAGWCTSACGVRARTCTTTRSNVGRTTRCYWT